MNYIKRFVENELKRYLKTFPAVAILGPRQCGKSTLAKQITSDLGNAVFLDLEDDTDVQKLKNPGLFFESHSDKLVCLDEIQLRPDLFPALRTIIDKNGKNGQLLILGSASRDLIKQSSETLAGRIGYIELTPFVKKEIEKEEVTKLWLRGGYPRSLLAGSDIDSYNWRKNFIQTYLERDLPQLGFSIPATTLKRLWTMIAHSTGQLLNSSKLGESLGVSHTTLRSYIDLLTQTFMVRTLEPYEANIKKRLVKSPKIYIRDTGILHSLLKIETSDDLLGHPIFGNSWEAFVVENILTVFSDWDASFYRTQASAEMDIVLTKGRKKIGVEIKASTAPKVTKGFWNSIEDLQLEKVFIVAPIKDQYPIEKNVTVTSLNLFLTENLS